MSPRSSSRDTSPAEAKAPADTYQVAACSGRGGVGSEEAPAGPGDSLVRRALTDIPTQAENGQGDTDTQPSAVRRTVTDLPPFVSDDPTMERRLARSIVSPISVKFTNELADRNGLARWKKTALAVTGARRLSHVRGGPLLQRSDSRIAGTMARQQEMERVQLDDGLDGFDDGVHLLEKRLKKMGLRTLRMGDDGNCQFRALSFNLFGSEDHHQLVRETCVAHILSTEEDYKIFFDENENEFERYCQEMAMSRTWGDELTLRACSDSFQVPIHVVQSTVKNWYLVYEPSKAFGSGGGGVTRKQKRLFVSYISPVHYNAIAPSK